jgi:hypothetical protein
MDSAVMRNGFFSPGYLESTSGHMVLCNGGRDYAMTNPHHGVALNDFFALTPDKATHNMARKQCWRKK